MSKIDELLRLGQEAVDAADRFRNRLAEAGEVRGADGARLNELRTKVVARTIANGEALDREIKAAKVRD